MVDRLTLGELRLEDGINHLCTPSNVSGTGPETANSALGIHGLASPHAMPTIKMDFAL